MTLQIQNTSLTEVIVAGLNELSIDASATVSAPFYAPYVRKTVQDAIASYPTLSMIALAAGSPTQIKNHDLLNAVTVVALDSLVIAANTTVVVPLSDVELTEAQIVAAIRPFPELVLLGGVILTVEIPTQAFDITNPVILGDMFEDVNTILENIETGSSGSAVVIDGLVADVLALQALPAPADAEFVPTTSTDWSGDPATIQEAIDRLATAVVALQLGTPIA